MYSMHKQKHKQTWKMKIFGLPLRVGQLSPLNRSTKSFMSMQSSVEYMTPSSPWDIKAITKELQLVWSVFLAMFSIDCIFIIIM